MTLFDGLANLLLDLLADLIKAINTREIRLNRQPGDFILEVGNLLRGEATPRKV